MKNLLFLLIFISVPGIANQPGFSQVSETPDEKKKFIETVQFLEENPLDKTAKEKRKWALPYAQNVDYPFCGKLSTLFLADEVRGEVLAQYLMKLAAFELENQGKDYDINKAQLAGLESALRVYEKIVEKEPSSKYERFDKLIKLKSKNQLMRVVEAAKCR